jgi:CDP-glycerol glycerophosphotransferase (TagB/SpsB family)
MSKRHFRFSIIMPVYNSETTVREAVESVMEQSLGYKDKIQLIIVDQGSTDSSIQICREYCEKYPENTVLTTVNTRELSGARNKGILYAEGDYIGFLDPEDKWETGALMCADSFFSDNPDVMFAACRQMSLTDAGGKSHPLDHTFKRTRTANIRKNQSLVTYSVYGTLFRADAFESEKFDEKAGSEGDALFVNSLLLDAEKYGLIREAVYMYRSSDKERAFPCISPDGPEYPEAVERLFGDLAGKSVSKYGETIPYIKELIMTELQRLIKESPQSMSSGETKEYADKLRKMLQQIDDKYILKQRQMTTASKSYAFRLKYGSGRDADREHRLAEKLRLRATILSAEDGYLVIQGRADERYISDGYGVEAHDSEGNIWKAEYRPYTLFDFHGADRDIILKGYEHILRLPLQSGKNYRFFLTDDKGWSKRIDLQTGRYSRLTEFEGTFFASGDHIVKRIGDSVRIYDYSLRTYLVSMHRYNRMLREKAGASDEVISVRRAAVRYRLTHKKPLWILSDRTHLARDNAAALFEYLMAGDARSKYDIRFLLEESSADLEKIRKTGRVIRFGSKEHRVLQAAASMIVSSHADVWVTNPYGKDLRYYRDLLDFKYAFIQHGIIMNDLSRWLSKYNKNIRLFVTSTRPEKDSIINGSYGYDDSVVKMTGLARYDSRKDSRERLIVIAPTWRKNISGETGDDSHRAYREDFASSAYCKFFNGLINDERLLDAMRKKNYKGLFCVHPAFDAQAGDFRGNDIISVQYNGNDYADMINRGAALITDYSSLAFDFAFLNKPVIYAQFDADVFYDSQFYDAGYYSYEDDGFGPVCYDHASTVENMISLIENDCSQPAEYANRVADTFEFTDRSSCKRIYSELEKLQN